MDRAPATQSISLTTQRLLGRRALLVFALASAAGAAACAGRPADPGFGDETPSTAPVAGRDGQLLSEQELGAITVSNAYEAVLQLRPLWLHSRGRRSSRTLTTEIAVAQNGRYFGPVNTLRQFSMEAVKELRYMDGPQATAYLQGLGSRHVEAAIIVVLR
jgi:hypothetical protein